MNRETHSGENGPRLLNGYQRDGILFQALCDLAWGGGFWPTLIIRGTHLNWTCVQVGRHEFDIDNEADRERLIQWAHAVRYREANSPLPEPAPSTLEYVRPSDGREG